MERPKVRKQTFNVPGHAQELTFSTYRRTQIFNDHDACELFLKHLDKSRMDLKFEVWAYALMPDHVHLLVWPTEPVYSVPKFLESFKRPFAKKILAELRDQESPLLKRLEHVDQDGRCVARVWQPGGGYDRNIHSTKVTQASIEYIHNNPVVCGLCRLPWDYPWSSAALYQGLPSWFEVDRAKP